MQWIPLIISLALAQGAGLLGAIFTRSAIPSWYVALRKPSLNPPSWVFGPVWTTLYVLMAVAAYLVYVLGMNPAVEEALILYAIQLVLNAAWSIVFFGMKRTDFALAVLILMWIAIAATIYEFAMLSHAAAWLLVPYILWVTFAGYLNYSIWKLN